MPEHPNPRERRGFTLMEIAVTLALAAIVIALVGSLFVASLTAWRRGQEVREAQVQAGALADLMARDVRNASQAPSVTIRPQFAVDAGEPILSIAAAATAAPGDASAWILYLFLPDRGEVLRQVVTAAPGGRITPHQSRVVATGVARITADQVASGVTIEVEVRRGRATAQTRVTAAPRNP